MKFPRKFEALRFAATLLGLLIAAVLVNFSSALADDISETQGFRKAVKLEGVREHQAALQSFADATGGNRVSSSAGYDQSVEYVVGRLNATGFYNVSVQEFLFPFSADLNPPLLERITAPGQVFVDGVDYFTMVLSGTGDTTAEVYAVDLNYAPGAPDNSNTSGCEAADFAGFPAGAIALMQRGTCPFRQKTENALAAGASGVIVMNEGNNAGRSPAFSGTLGTPPINAAVVGTSAAVGNNLRNGVSNGATGVTVHLRTNRIAETRTTRNVIAETLDGDPSRVVVIGAHLDSVTRGPGINDNGSGSASILEVAETFAAQDREPRNKLRFMWYGAEEFGLLGSAFYVSQLSQAERDNILLMLNFDMVGSPNYVRFVYDGDNSSFPVGPGVQLGPPGSDFVEEVFSEYFTSQGLASDPTPFSGRSDYGPFITNGIPAGGLFTGAEGTKTAAQAAVYGGSAGVPYDICYHLACDTFNNVNTTGLDEMLDAVAHAVLFFSKFKGDPANPLEQSHEDRGNGQDAPGGGGGADNNGWIGDDHDNVVDQ